MCCRSRITADTLSSSIRLRAIRITSQATGKNARSRRKASRNKRLARFRSTARRKVRLLAMTPQRLQAASAAITRTTTVRPTTHCPSWNIRAKLLPRRKRCFLPKPPVRMSSGWSVTNSSTRLHRRQADPALAATTLQYLTTILRGHPCPEAHLACTLFYRWLIRPFHNNTLLF